MFMVTATAPKRYITGGRELRKYAGYWFIRLTPSEREEYPGTHWSGWVIFHKWKWWSHYGEHFWHHEGFYRYADGDPDNIRVTNIVVQERALPAYH